MSTASEDMSPTCLSRKHTKGKVTYIVRQKSTQAIGRVKADTMKLGLILGRAITGVQAFC